MATNNANNFSNPLIVPNGGTGLASLTTYAPLLGGTASTSALQQVALGATGTALTSAGAAALPTWANGAGAITELSTQTVSGVSNINFDNTIINSTYTKYLCVYNNFVYGFTSPPISFIVSSDNGSTFLTTGYQSGNTVVTYNSTSLSPFSLATAAYIYRSQGAATVVNGYFYVNFPASAPMSYVGRWSQKLAANSQRGKTFGNNTSTATVNYMRVQVTSSTFSGTFTVYGISS